MAAVRWGEFAAARPLFDAVTVGKIDHWVVQPVQAPDEDFHRATRAWAHSNAYVRGARFGRIAGFCWGFGAGVAVVLAAQFLG